MYCPSCGYKQLCPCNSCENIRRKSNYCYNSPWRNTEYDGISCFNCGLTRHIDWWAELSIEIDLKDLHETT